MGSEQKAERNTRMQNEFDNPDEWEEEEPYYDWDDPDWREDWDDVDAPDFIGGAAAMSAPLPEGWWGGNVKSGGRMG